MQLKITRTEKPTPDSVSIYFELPEEMKRFKAGQHGRFAFDINGTVYHRTYSFHTSPTDREAGITIRAVPDGVVSNYLQSMDSKEIAIHGISGDFFLEP